MVNYLQKLAVMAELCVLAPTNSFGLSASTIDRVSIFALRPPPERNGVGGFPKVPPGGPVGAELQECIQPTVDANTPADGSTVPTTSEPASGEPAPRHAEPVIMSSGTADEKQSSRKRSREPSEAGDAVGERQSLVDELPNDTADDENRERGPENGEEGVDEADDVTALQVNGEAEERVESDGVEEDIATEAEEAAMEEGDAEPAVAHSDLMDVPLQVFTNWWEPL
jgi:hypothetical protein